ncbi:MAG: hypothetical protein AAGM38_08105, partial [Pseudomonadota bacterium]
MSSLSREKGDTLLTEADRLARALGDLRRGAPIALIGADDGALVIAAEETTDARLTALRAIAPRPVRLAISAARAATLKARAYDGDLARIT